MAFLQDVDVSIVRTDLEERVIRTVPPIEHLFNEMRPFAQHEPDWPLVGFASGVAFHLNLHKFSNSLSIWIVNCLR